MDEADKNPAGIVEQAVYYTGERFFQDGEAIFINRSVEHPKSEIHAHSFLEIAYVASGCGIHLVGSKEYRVSRGDLFIINHNMPHVFRSLTMDEQRLIVYNCGFNPDFIDSSLVDCCSFVEVIRHLLFHSFFPEESINGPDVHLNMTQSREVELLYQKMLGEFTQKQCGYIEILRAYVIELLVLVFRAYQNSRVLENHVDIHRSHVVEEVMRYMQNNLSDDLRIDKLSVMAFLSSNHFCKLFKETTGMTVIEYAQKIRIDEACHQLVETERKVIDIAAEVGYRDIKFFNQVFKRIMGETPGNYRKKCKR